MPRPLSFINFPSAISGDGQPDAGYDACCDRVHDGDTFMCYLGLHRLELYPYIAVRIAGFYAPELWEKGGKEATAALQQIMPRDTPLKVKVVAKSFNRLVATVTLADSGEDLGGVLAARARVPGQVLLEGDDLFRPKLADHFPIPPILEDPQTIKMLLHSRDKNAEAVEEASRRG